MYQKDKREWSFCSLWYSLGAKQWGPHFTALNPSPLWSRKLGSRGMWLHFGRCRARILESISLLKVFQWRAPSSTDHVGACFCPSSPAYRGPLALVPGLSWNTSSCHRSATILSPTSEPCLGDAAGRSQREPRLGGEKGDPWRSLQGTSLRSTPTSVLHLEKSSHLFRNQTQKSQCITWISCDLSALPKKVWFVPKIVKHHQWKWMVIEITEALMN